jgi:hypothetical protein
LTSVGGALASQIQKQGEREEGSDGEDGPKEGGSRSREAGGEA